MPQATYRQTVTGLGYIKRSRMRVPSRIPTMSIEDFKLKTEATDQEIGDLLGVDAKTIRRIRNGEQKSRIPYEISLAAYYYLMTQK